MAERFAELRRHAGSRSPSPPTTSTGLRLVRDRGPAGMDVAAGEYGYDLAVLPATARRRRGRLPAGRRDALRRHHRRSLARRRAVPTRDCARLSAHCAPPGQRARLLRPAAPASPRVLPRPRPHRGAAVRRRARQPSTARCVPTRPSRPRASSSSAPTPSSSRSTSGRRSEIERAAPATPPTSVRRPRQTRPPVSTRRRRRRRPARLAADLRRRDRGRGPLRRRSAARSTPPTPRTTARCRSASCCPRRSTTSSPRSPPAARTARPITSRGGGTSLAGQCTQRRGGDRLLEVPAPDRARSTRQRRRARVQPGCILDHLRDAAEPSTT